MSFITKKAGKLEYSVAENIGVSHGFTTRFGGVSTGSLASLNIGTRRGDDPKNVLENYTILGKELGFQPENLVLTRQTHTDIVLTVDESHRGRGLFSEDLPECDGLITNTSGVGLVVFTADCTPILLWDRVTGAVGAVHAGWRGTAAQIGAKAVRAMAEHYGSHPENICAAIGPNIGQCCFETDADVPDAMVSAFGEEAKAYIRKENEKYYVNLKELNALSLRRAGVESIVISDECTACRPDKFWSHRRAGSNRGSQGAIIICR